MAKCSATPRRQRGHATMLTVILFAISALAVTGMYNVGQQTTNKVRLQTVSDAAAYSVGTLVARDLNFKAYTNRAMVANQVAVAQMIGLASWSTMLRNAGQNFGRITSALNVIPVIGNFIAAVGRAIQTGARVIDEAITAMARVVVPLLEAHITALSEAQRAFHVATLGMAHDALTTVISRSDPDIDTGAIATNGVFWRSFRTAWSGQQDRYRAQRANDNSQAAREARSRIEEFRGVTEASGDWFVNRRSYAWMNGFGIPPFDVEIRKFGGSELMPVTDRDGNRNYNWTAMDSVAFRTRTYRFRTLSWRSWREFGIPFGWGAAHSLNTGGNTFNYGQHSNARRADNGRRWGYGTWELPRTTSVAATQYRNRNLNVTSALPGAGLRPFFDLQTRGRLPDEQLNVQVLLLKRADRMRTWNTSLREAGQQPQPAFDVEQRGGMAGGTMAALAKSGIYFSREVNAFRDSRISETTWRRADGRREYSNTYNPFWQVRLLPSSNGERTAALAFAQIRM